VSAFQVSSFVGIPITVVLVAVVLIALARPDGEDTVYAAYLALASLLSLYLLLVALAGTAEGITRQIVVGDHRSEFGNDIATPVLSLFSGDDPGGAIAAFATTAVLMGASLGFHQRRRTELASTGDASVDDIDRAYRAGVCFTMVTVIAGAAFIAGTAGYEFFHQPVAGAGDQVRDVSMGLLLSYGGLVLVAGLIFRANVWAIRGNDESPEVGVTAAEPADVDDA
jgi:hypothetical protein